MHLVDRAENILGRLLTRAELRTGRIILIGHSLGGLVIKQLFRTLEMEARKNATAASLLDRIDKVAFLATPHTGADLAITGDRWRILVRPSAATLCLVPPPASRKIRIPCRPGKNRVQMFRQDHDGVDRERTFAPTGVERRPQRVDVIDKRGRMPVRERHREEERSAWNEVAPVSYHWAIVSRMSLRSCGLQATSCSFRPCHIPPYNQSIPA